MEIENKIFKGDAAKVLKKFPDNSVDFIVTSPPYSDLYLYGGSADYDFDTIARELYRVLRFGCAMVWVEGSVTRLFVESDAPFIHALRFRDIGFKRLDTMIYQKKGFGKPEPEHRKRYVQNFEYMFVLTKGLLNKWHPIKDRKNTCAGMRHTGRTIRQKDGTLKTNKREVLYYREYGLRMNVWQYQNAYGHGTRDRIAYEHPSTFPEKMVKDHILSWSDEQDLVLDPFMGSGTTAKMALLNKRKFVGIEKEKKYIDITNKRLANLVLEISAEQMKNLS